MGVGTSFAANRLRGCHPRGEGRLRFGQQVLQAIAPTIGGAHHAEAGNRSERGRHGNAGTTRSRRTPPRRRPVPATARLLQGDAYNATAALLGESGLALALDRDRLSGLRGVHSRSGDGRCAFGAASGRGGVHGDDPAELKPAPLTVPLASLLRPPASPKGAGPKHARCYRSQWPWA